MAVNRIPVGAFLGVDAATLHRAERVTLINLQRCMLRSLDRERRFWFWMTVATNLGWLIGYLVYGVEKL